MCRNPEVTLFKIFDTNNKKKINLQRKIEIAKKTEIISSDGGH